MKITIPEWIYNFKETFNKFYGISKKTVKSDTGRLIEKAVIDRNKFESSSKITAAIVSIVGILVIVAVGIVVLTQVMQFPAEQTSTVAYNSTTETLSKSTGGLNIASFAPLLFALWFLFIRRL